RIRAIHAGLRDDLIAACDQSPAGALAAVAADAEGDTQFALDRVSEERLLTLCADLAGTWPLILIAEGLPDRRGIPLPAGSDAGDAELRIIVDPLDGTRGLMFQKRPAWILTGVAPNRGADTSLADIELAVQTEVPLVKQHLCDTWWAVAGRVAGERLNRLDGETQPLAPTPARATGLAHGYGGLARFFPGDITELAAIEDAVVERILGPKQPGKAHALNDQYASTGGQIAELIAGHDRWMADLRPLLARAAHARGRPPAICCHPYDICTESIARAAGVQVTDEHGGPLRAALDASVDVAWIGYANAEIRALVEPVLQTVLRERGLLP
ncbi:MAG: inositol monophosphatase, partial [Planctomycetota bacterium]